MTDPWAAWLRERRHGGDDARLREILDRLGHVRDRVLDHAQIRAGDTVLDVGCGDGLIAFGALDRVGTRGRVVFSDISEELLDRCRERAGDDSRCEFVPASADNLPLGDESVDVVTTRSVLIYLRDKPRAIREFHRVLRAGGRISLFEPINSYAYPQPPERFAFWDVTGVQELADRVKEYYRSAAADETLLDFDEHDLLRWAEETGFAEAHLEYHVDVEPPWPIEDWEAFLDSSGNPLAPTLREAVRAALEPEAADRFLTHLRAEHAAGRGVSRNASAYLWAVKESR